MDRRRLLQSLCVLPLTARSMGAYAAPDAGSKFLLVFLRGGLDTASLVVPAGADFYYEARPGIAIARPGSGPDAADALDGYWGLHPVLRTTLLPLYRRGELACVAFAGCDDLSRSHFETQDTIELGQPPGSGRDFTSGFLNRLVRELGGVRPIAFTAQVPLALRGAIPVGNVALGSVARSALDARQRDLIATMYAPTPYAVPVGEGFAERQQVLEELADEVDKASRGAAGSKGFERDAQRMARLLRDRFDLGFIDVGGWDTHVAQGAATGTLATRMEELGRGLAAFAAAMGDRWHATTVVVLSEFGRTLRENGNHGTDHGHGTTYLVLGGGVRGGRVAGEQLPIAPEHLNQNRDLPVLNEYRAVLGGMFRRQYGLSETALQRVFPGAPARDLQLL